MVHEPDGITTANEIPVPVGEPVEIELTSRDVIHSFWVPQLAAKVDVIPGQRNLIRFTARQPGIYRGQCAEFCGIQHAHMVFFVDAMTPAGYEAWLDHHRHRTPPSPASATAAAGLADSSSSESCAGCHTIAGTTRPRARSAPTSPTSARVEPSVPARSTTRRKPGRAGSATARTFKPGNKMPPSELSPAQIDGIVAYLESQK